MSMTIVLLISAFIAAADQIIKLVIRTIPLNEIVFRIPHVLEITHCINTGAAFSLLSGQTALLTIGSVALICVITCLVLMRLRLSVAGKVAYAVLMGGGIGNLIDRVLFGGVTDYVRLLFIRFPVFNLADVAITLAALCLMILTFTDGLEIHTGE